MRMREKLRDQAISSTSTRPTCGHAEAYPGRRNGRMYFKSIPVKIVNGATVLCMKCFREWEGS